jgi:hypothetical protein
MRFLQRWLDEPDAAIARFAKAFYVLTYLFMAVFLVQLVFLTLRGGHVLVWGDVVQPLVSLFLMLAMYSLALDGRRSYKAMKAQREATTTQDLVRA